MCGYLNVDQQFKEVFGRHDDGGVEGDDVAFVQAEVQVGCQSLGWERGREREKSSTLKKQKKQLHIECVEEAHFLKDRCPYRV